MIIDKLDNLGRYAGALKELKTVQKILSEVDFASLPVGQYKSDDERVRYNVFSYTTDNESSPKAEYHEKEIDLQILISGEEKMDLSANLNDEVVDPYNPLSDAGFVKNDKDVAYFAKPGYFAIFFPHEPHAPSLKWKESSVVKKVVFKILAN